MRDDRPSYLESDGKTVTKAWEDAYAFEFKRRGKITHRYVPTEKGLDFHESTALNCILEGSRGTGKSKAIRNDAHMRALSHPGYDYLIVRRTMPQLRKSHLKFIGAEMKALGGYFNKTESIAYYPNGSLGFYGHCQTEDDTMNLLSSEFCAIYFDEISTFTWEMVTRIAACLRVPEGSGLMPIVRGGTNPIGVGASEIRRYYITKDITPEEDEDYIPDDYQAIHTTLDDNPYVDRVQYVKRLKNLPDHIRRAWLDGEWIVEGMYFHDYRPKKRVKAGADEVPWHVMQEYPLIYSRAATATLDDPFKWIKFYRAIDWGFSPDPAVCLWIAQVPVYYKAHGDLKLSKHNRAFVMKERQWHSTTAKDVAKDIYKESEGYHIVETFCDPTMFVGSEATDFQSVGDIFDNNRVPLSPSTNDRSQAGFAIHEYLNTILEDGLPQLQIFEYECPHLVRTLGEVRVDTRHPERIADSRQDHWVITLSYFCSGRISTSKEHKTSSKPKWMQPNPNVRSKLRHLGDESVRRR